MGAVLYKEDYLEYFHRVLRKLEKEKEYITELDAATGDGDHWVNMYTGFSKLFSAREELKRENFETIFKKSGMILMSGIGGSSGVLYGGAYINASKVLKDVNEINITKWLEILQAMLGDIKNRGKAEVGHKTMIDSLEPAVNSLKASITNNVKEVEALEAMKKSALEGAEETRDMEAVFGRAVYQAKKGLGHLDPGAVTMAYQIEILANLFLEKIS